MKPEDLIRQDGAGLKFESLGLSSRDNADGALDGVHMQNSVCTSEES